LNDAALALYPRWRGRSDVEIRHIAGRRDFERCRDAIAAARAPGDVLGYEVVAYDDDIETAYAGASAFVCRAGAVTCAELAVTGMPAVLVPLPGAPADHQTRNAMSLAGAGAAIVVRDEELDGARLDRELSVLLDDGARLDAMSRAARSLARRDAAARVADLVEEAAGPAAAEAAA
jgi:UDP-N-acetylglucosamine:LPS N-acetylglucosamine transferase